MAEVIVVHGYPGSGRTTQCKRVARDGFDGRPVRHVSVGDRLRAIQSREVVSDFSPYILTSPTPSHLPDDIVNSVVFEALGTPEADELLLIDGYPRYTHAVDIFRASLKARNHTFLGTVALEISLNTSLDRVLSRAHRIGDATDDAIRESETIFQYNRHFQTTRFALLGLSALAAVEVIDATSDEDTVHNHFTDALGRLVHHT